MVGREMNSGGSVRIFGNHAGGVSSGPRSWKMVLYQPCMSDIMSFFTQKIDD